MVGAKGKYPHCPVHLPDAAEQYDWLSLGSKHRAPTITSKSGIGTAYAVAEARVTRKEIEGWCAN